MPVGAIEREIQDACVRLAESAATARRCVERYLDGRGGPAGMAGSGRAGRDLVGIATALTAAHPWALGGFGDQAWDGYRPDPHAPPPDGLRVGLLRTPGGPPLPMLPAVARFARHGHVLISERDGARSLLQALVLRLATATGPGTVRFALADPVGQGRHLSAFLRLPAQLRMGTAGGGVAARPAEIQALLTTLTGHVVEVTQQRLTNVYDSVEAYNAATTGVQVPYHVLVLAGFPAGVDEQAAELLGSLARNGPRAGLYILATLDPSLQMPRGFDLAALTALSTNLGLDARGDLTWDDPDSGGARSSRTRCPRRPGPTRGWMRWAPPPVRRPGSCPSAGSRSARRGAGPGSAPRAWTCRSAWTAGASRSASSWASAACTTAWSAGTSGWARPTCCTC
jgi:hypothetical protein